MDEIRFSREERQQIEAALQSWLLDETGAEISSFDAGFLLDFIAEKIGPYFYNRGIYDTQALLERQMDDIRDKIYGLEKKPLR